jgi:hypothetical protein
MTCLSRSLRARRGWGGGSRSSWARRPVLGGYPGRQLPWSRSLADQLGSLQWCWCGPAPNSPTMAISSPARHQGPRSRRSARSNHAASSPSVNPATGSTSTRVCELERFPQAAWKQAMGRVLDRVPSAQPGYPDPAGAWELRAALVGHLARSRRIVTEGTGLLTTSGFVQAFGLVCQVLRAAGAATIALEEPGQFVERTVVVHLRAHAASGSRRAAPRPAWRSRRGPASARQVAAEDVDDHVPLQRRATRGVRSSVLGCPTDRPRRGRNPIARASTRPRAVHSSRLRPVCLGMR